LVATSTASAALPKAQKPHHWLVLRLKKLPERATIFFLAGPCPTVKPVIGGESAEWALFSASPLGPLDRSRRFGPGKSGCVI
jgi:hypothetical protein